MCDRVREGSAHDYTKDIHTHTHPFVHTTSILKHTQCSHEVVTRCDSYFLVVVFLGGKTCCKVAQKYNDTVINKKKTQLMTMNPRNSQKFKKFSSRLTSPLQGTERGPHFKLHCTLWAQCHPGCWCISDLHSCIACCASDFVV